MERFKYNAIFNDNDYPLILKNSDVDSGTNFHCCLSSHNFWPKADFIKERQIKIDNG